MGFLWCNLALAPRHSKEVAYKTLFRPQLKLASLSRNSDCTGGEVAEGPAGDGEIHVVSAICWTNLSGPSLKARREQSSLTFFYKIHSGTVSLQRDKNLARPQT